MSSTKLVFFGLIGKSRWSPLPLIGWDIVDFSSKTTEGNSTKLDREQYLNVLYQVCVFRADRKNQMAAQASYWLKHFRLSSETAERNSTKLDRKQDLNVLYQVCVFRTDWKNKMAALVSDWLKHFFTSRLKSLECNKTWQEARYQCPLSSLCFSCRSEKKRWPHRSLIGRDIFDFSSETINRNSTKLDRKQGLNVFCHVSVFGPIGKSRWLPWPLIGWDIFDFSSETAEWKSTKLDKKQGLNVLCHTRFFGRRLESQDDRPGIWLAETLLTSPLKTPNGFQLILTGIKISMSSAKFVFSGPIGKAVLASDKLRNLTYNRSSYCTQTIER